MEVTQEHINQGLPEDCGVCPVALAVKEALPYITRCFVDGNTIELQRTDVQSIPTPLIARRFILDFDNKIVGLPFNFDIEVKEFFLMSDEDIAGTSYYDVPRF